MLLGPADGNPRGLEVKGQIITLPPWFYGALLTERTDAAMI